jgi:CTP synthase
VGLRDSYKSIEEALVHGGIANDATVEIAWVDSEAVTEENAGALLAPHGGLLVPPGFGERGIEGMLEAIRFARVRGMPFLGLCLGMQCAVIEFARNVCGLEGATSQEFDPRARHQVIHLMPSQQKIVRKGGTMRLGAWPCVLREGTLARSVYGNDSVSERHRHRYEVNNAYRELLEDQGLVFSGISPDGELVEMAEVPDHPWFLGSQFHPELRSRPTRPHPLFRDFVRASLAHRRSAAGAPPAETEAAAREEGLEVVGAGERAGDGRSGIASPEGPSDSTVRAVGAREQRAG